MIAIKDVRILGRRPDVLCIKIGNRGDNKAETVRFILSSAFTGAAVYLHLSINDYSDIVQLGDGCSYTPTRTHTQYPGEWTAWLEALMPDDVVWKSDVFSVVIGHIPDDGEQIEQAYPTAIEEALRAVDTLTGVGARAETLPAGSEATVRTETDADGNRKLVFGIPGGGGGGGGVDFTTDDTLVLENGILRVNTTDVAEADNTRPITSAGVHTIIGNINAILRTI